MALPLVLIQEKDIFKSINEATPISVGELAKHLVLNFICYGSASIMISDDWLL
jgi:hypothetical protein